MTYPAPRGSLPVLQYCTPDQLHIDPTYQREIDSRGQKLVERIAREWDWGLCQPLVVARRNDLALYVVDGQHRLSAARVRGDINQLPCVIVPVPAEGGEAATFVKLNQQRRPLTPHAIYRAAVAAGVEDARALDTMLRECGLSVTGSANIKNLKPGQLNNISALRSFQRLHGDKVMGRALQCLAQGFAGQVLRFGGSMFLGVSTVVAEVGESLDIELFGLVLADISQDDWMDLFAADAAKTGRTRYYSAGPVMLAAYREAAA